MDIPFDLSQGPTNIYVTPTVRGGRARRMRDTEVTPDRPLDVARDRDLFGVSDVEAATHTPLRMFYDRFKTTLNETMAPPISKAAALDLSITANTIRSTDNHAIYLHVFKENVPGIVGVVKHIWLFEPNDDMVSLGGWRHWKDPGVPGIKFSRPLAYRRRALNAGKLVDASTFGLCSGIAQAISIIMRFWPSRAHGFPDVRQARNFIVKAADFAVLDEAAVKLAERNPDDKVCSTYISSYKSVISAGVKRRKLK